MAGWVHLFRFPAGILGFKGCSLYQPGLLLSFHSHVIGVTVTGLLWEWLSSFLFVLLVPRIMDMDDKDQEYDVTTP